MIPPTNQQIESIKQAIFAGQKIEAIKLYREATGLGLKESKEAVEKLESELRATQGERFAKRGTSAGCFPVVVAGWLALAVIIAWSLA